MDKPIALVTGANRGIGLEISRQLAVAGHKVWLGVRDPAKGIVTEDGLKAAGLEVASVRIDVTDPATITAALHTIDATDGRLDVLVNNAGILIDPHGGTCADLNPNVLRRTLEANLIGAVTVTQTALPLMQRHHHGRIVNLASGLGQLTEMGAGTPAYRISKTALNAFTRTLAAELADSGIKVNAMCPGWVRTDMGGPDAPRSVEQGADTAVWLATLPDDGPSGGFFRDRAAIAW